MWKTKSILLYLGVALLTVLLVSSCGKSGSLNPNSRPTVEITSYEGSYDSTSTDSVVFYQKIYFNGTDQDGVIEGFSYRVLDSLGNPVLGTPGNEVTDENGWIYHYADGADESIPLDSENAQKTIWNEKPYAIINFPTPDSAGVVVQHDSTSTNQIPYYLGKYGFEVRARDNRGSISEASRKFYKPYAYQHTLIISTTSGELDGKIVGKGIRVQFELGRDVDIPFIDDFPYYYNYKLKRVNVETGETEYESNWYSTEDYEDTDRVLLLSEYDNGDDKPTLVTDYNEFGRQITESRILATVVNYAGVESQVDSVSFAVSDDFYPGTEIYLNDIFLIGNYHYSLFQESAVQKVLDPIAINGELHFPIPFFTNKDGKFVAVGEENDLIADAHWGYKVEYEGDNPNNRKTAIVKDERTSRNYLSEIQYFDIRLDGQPFSYQGLPAEEYNYTDEENKTWLRAPINVDESQTPVLSDLDPGTHYLEVRAVDLQGKPDPTPATLEFEVVRPYTDEEREGILIVDDEKNNFYSPEATVDSLYNEYLSDFDGKVDLVKRDELKTTYSDKLLHFGKDVLSPSDLQKYKLVIYHIEHPNITQPDAAGFHLEYTTMKIFSQLGGNLLLTGGRNINNIQDEIMNNGFSELNEYFGLDLMTDDAIKAYVNTFPTQYDNRTYFIGALSNSDMYPNIDLNFQYIVTSTGDYFLEDIGGMGPVSYIEPDYLYPTAEILYNFKCREVGDGPYDPSTYEKDYYESKPVLIKNDNGQNKFYLSTFPFTYMETAEVKEMMQNILNDVFEE